MDYAMERKNSFQWPEMRYLFIPVFGYNISNKFPSSSKPASF